MAFRMVKVRLANEGQPFSFKLNDLRNLLELDYIRVLSHGCNLLAVFDVYIFLLVSSVLDGITVTRLRTLTSQTRHLVLCLLYGLANPTSLF